MPSVVTLTGPGTATVTDDAAAAIALQTAQLKIISVQLSGIGNSLATISNQNQAIAKAMSDVKIAIGTLAVSQAALTSVEAMAAASQIQTNNFQMEATTEALARAGLPPPTVPPVTTQLKSAVVDGLALNEAAEAQGATSTLITSSLASMGTWIIGTQAYTTVSGWLSSAGDALLQILPDSVQSAIARAKSNVGG